MILKDRAARWVANHLPARVAYFTAIRVAAYATTGQYSDTVVPSLGALEAIVRFENDRVGWPTR